MDSSLIKNHAETLVNLCGDLMMNKLPHDVFANSVAVISKEMGGATKDDKEFEVVTMHTRSSNISEAKAKMLSYLSDTIGPHIQVIKSEEAGVLLMSLPVYTGEGVCQKMIGDADEDVIDWTPHNFDEMDKAS